jgi:hypothetical protein
VEFNEEFLPEFWQYSEAVRRHVYLLIEILKEFGPQLGRPRVDTLKGSKHSNMKELRFDADGGVWRVAFAFDPERRAILLVARDKGGVGQRRVYRDLLLVADRRFDQHLKTLRSQKRKQ